MIGILNCMYVLRNLGFKVLADQGKYIPDVGKIKTFTAAGTHVVTAESQPTLEIELTQDLIEGLPNIDTAINSKKTEVDTAKIALVPSKQIFQVVSKRSKNCGAIFAKPTQQCFLQQSGKRGS